MGLIQLKILEHIAFWLALAIPTSRIASRYGHPKWIAYAAWFPFTLGWIAVGIVLLSPHTPGIQALGIVGYFYWLPGAAYLWVLASKMTEAN